MRFCERWFPSEKGFVKRRVALPDLAAGEVLIDAAAFGINRLDTELAANAGALGTDATLGLEVAGTVAALGAGPSEFKVGDRVMALVKENGYADRVVAPAGTTLKIPDRLSFEQGAALPEALFTAWLNLFELGALKAGESVLIHHATGGVGIVGAQLAKALGASVAVTSRRPENLAKLRGLGFDGKTTDEFDAEPGAMGGFDVILDIRGAQSLDANLSVLKTGGRLVLVDSYTGEEGKINLGRMLDKRLSVQGSLLRPLTLERKSVTAAGIRARALPLIESGKIEPVIARVFSPENIGEAHALLAANGHFGKLIVSLRG